MQCPKCQGKGFIEYEHGLLQVGCAECEGTGETVTIGSSELLGNVEIILDDNSDSGTESDNQPVGSRNTRQSRKPQKQKAGKKTTKRAG